MEKVFTKVSTLTFNDFCKTYSFNTIRTYNTLQLLDRTSIINLSKRFNNKTTVQFIVSNSILFNYLETHSNLNNLIKTILRSYGGIFEHETKIILQL